MSPSLKRQTPRTIAIGGACLVGLGLAGGCARENGLDILARQDAKTDSAVAERANESILRSKQELAGAGGKKSADLASAETEADDKPALASRWKAPFKGVGGFLKKKPDEASDPFLAEAPAAKPKDAAKDAEAAKVKDSIALLQQEKAAGSKSGSPAERNLAMADTRSKSPGVAETAKAKSESQAALDDFLKSQEPVGVDKRATPVVYEKDLLTRKPGSASRPQPSAEEMFADHRPAKAPASDEAAEHRTLGGRGAEERAVASRGTARPFPPDLEPAEPAAPAAKPTSRLRQNAPAQDTAIAATTTKKKRPNPLVEDEPEVAESDARIRQATGREIAALLKKARTAGDLGQFDDAMSYAVAASDLAEQCSYEFTSREQKPEKLIDWLADKQAEAEQIELARTERRQMLAARKQSSVEARQTSFSTPAPEKNPFAEAVEGLTIPERNVASESKAPAGNSPFNEWAAGVGKQPATNGRMPEWPVLSRSELAASDDMWQPSRAGFEKSWTSLASAASSSSQRMSGSSHETHLASAEADAPPFVATADGHRSTHAPIATHGGDPLVQLGEPTDLAPNSRDALLARADGSRRGPRLAAPPPLSIEDGEAAAVGKSRARGIGRTAWYGIVAGLCLLLLAGFRRWAYRAAAEKT